MLKRYLSLAIGFSIILLIGALFQIPLAQTAFQSSAYAQTVTSPVTSTQNTNPYTNNYTNRYQNSYSNPYSNRYSNQYSNNQYSNQYNQYSNQYSNQNLGYSNSYNNYSNSGYSNQYQNQGGYSNMNTGFAPWSKRTPKAAKGKAGQKGVGTPARSTPKPAISKTASAGKEGPSESKYEAPEAKFPLQAIRTTLHFFPLDIMTRQNKDFDVAIVLNNTSEKSVNGFAFTVAYDSKRLSFLKYDASELSPYLGNPNKGFQIERLPGKLIFSCDLSRPLDNEENYLVKLSFATSDIPGKTELRFLTPPQATTAVYSHKENILGGSKGELGGVLHSIVAVMPAVSNEEDSVLADNGAEPLAVESKMDGWLVPPTDAKPDAPVLLALQAPEQTAVTLGKDFWVDLVLYNDRLAPIESIGITLQFDPKLLQVIDEDKNNWIARGVNIWDGAFHDSYPFDVQQINNVDNAAGTIAYRMARGGGFDFPTGIFARVHFKAIASAPSTAISIVRSSLDGTPATYVNAYGLDRLKQTMKETTPKVNMRILAEAAK